MLANSQSIHEPNSSGPVSTTVTAHSHRRQACCGSEKPDNTSFHYKAGWTKNKILPGPTAFVSAKKQKVEETNVRIHALIQYTDSREIVPVLTYQWHRSF